MSKTTNNVTTGGFVWGDLLYCELDRKLVRFVRWEGIAAIVMDRNTLKELPDYRHPCQIRKV